MDVTTIETVSEDTGTIVHFTDAAGEPLYDGEGDTKTPVTALVVGTYSERYRKALKKVTDQNIRANRMGERVDSERVDANTFRLEAASIIEWSFTANGQSFPITADNWKALVAKQPQWQDQVASAMTAHARFFVKKSPG